MMHLQPLLAADLIQTIFGVIVFIIWIVGQILGSREQAKRKQRPARPRQQGPAAPADLGQRPPNQGPANQGPRNQEDALRSEVEEFLRRAQGKTEQPKQAPRQQTTRPGMPPPEEPPRQPSRDREAAQREQRHREQQRRQREQERRTRQAQRSTPQKPTLRSEGVAQHVERHLDTGDIQEHTRSLGARVATADERVEERIHDKFDHSLGRLGHREEAVELGQESSDLASEVAKMLSKPEGMRQLIIANEILRRPDW